MIPSAAKMPLPAPAPERADLPSAIPTSANGDSHSDNDMPSFASRLDQQVTPVRPPRSASSSKRGIAVVAQRNAAHAARNADEARKATLDAHISTATQDSTAPSPADADGHPLNDANNSVGLSQKEKTDKKENQADQDTQSVAPNPINPIPLPPTPANLAITNGIAPVPVAVQQVNDTFLLPDAAPASTPIPVPGASVSATLLNLPGVPMDSRTAVQTAVPGVVNALPQNSATSAPASLSILTVSTLPVSTLPLQTVPARTQTMTVPETITASFAAPSEQTAQTANIQTMIPTHNAASTPQTPVATPQELTTKPVSTPLAAVSVSTPFAAPTNTADLVQQMIAQQMTAKQTNVPIVAPSALNSDTSTGTQIVPNTGSVSQEAASGVTIQLPDAKVSNENVPDEKTSREARANPTEVPTAGASTTGISPSVQNLGGIERLFTLGANKTTETRITQEAALETTNGDSRAFPAISPGSLLTPSAGSNQQMPVPITPQVHHAAANTVPAASLLPTAVPTSAGAPSAVVSTPAVAVALAAVVTGANNAQPPLEDSIRTLGGMPASSSSGSTTGVNNGAGNALFAPVGAQAKTGGDTSADGNRQDESRREETTSSENKADSAAQSNSAAPSTNVQASGESAATNAAAAPNGSSQIARAQIVEQVTRHLETMRISNGEGEIRMRLAPAHLGNVQISVARHQEGVVARIAVESAQIQQAMNGAKAHLRATLEARGLRVSSVEVTVTPNQIGNDGAAFAGQRNWQSTGDRAQSLPGYSRPSSTVQAADDNLAPVSPEVPAAHISQSRLDYRA